jgi:folate-binding protein YgfZ
MGEDIWEKCIPQELDRNAQAISFTKGCYLGQETIARLDALGQIQKKLCLLKIDGTSVQPGTAILADDKEVGTVSSVAPESDATFALGVIRRGYFDSGTVLTCNGAQAAVQ